VTGHLLMYVLTTQTNGATDPSDTLFQINFGNPALVTDGSNQLTWTSSGYSSVVHMDNIVAATFTRESTFLPATGLNGWGKFVADSFPAIVPVQVGSGGSYNGTTDLFTRTGSLLCPGNQDFSIGIWGQLPPGAARRSIASKINCVVQPTAYWWMAVEGNGFLSFECQASAGANFRHVEGITRIDDNLKHWLVVTRSGATIRLYKDAVLEKLEVGGGTTNITDDGGDNQIANACRTLFWPNLLDDFRMQFGLAWSQDRITSMYNNMKNVKNPSTFYAVI